MKKGLFVGLGAALLLTLSSCGDSRSARGVGSPVDCKGRVQIYTGQSAVTGPCGGIAKETPRAAYVSVHTPSCGISEASAALGLLVQVAADVLSGDDKGVKDAGRAIDDLRKRCRR